MENGFGWPRGSDRIQMVVKQILDLEKGMNALSDSGLRRKTQAFRERLSGGETLDSLLPEAFAVVRETARRVLGMEPFPVQLAGGVVLHQGNIAEMRTGEGKTLAAALPAYLNALTGQGVHVVTVNDYLAKRDRDQMGRVHEFLGLSTGVVLGGMKGPERRAAYACDVTYITDHELGFDYLRDNMALRPDQVVQRGLHYAIIDEVDSILIDEARTPLIISGEGSRPTKLYEACDLLARRMERGADLKELTKLDILSGVEREETGDFAIVEKERRAVLTAGGIEKVERFFRLENLADPENVEIQRHMNLALRANYLMVRDRDYVVQDGEVLIVDSFTGRAMPGRRYSDGLHQAIEAKERVRIRKESRTAASITYQSFFNKYRKKAGMTGTARTAEEEFRRIYGMDVVEIPTNRAVLRRDRQDVLYRTREEKLDAVCDAVARCVGEGRPVLVGTASVGASEELGRRLEERGIPHSVLNAKQHEREAAVVARAGRSGAVTIATNMAGRGTDIKLEADHFTMRTRLLEYDRVVNEQREIVYRQRRQVLEAEDVHGIVRRLLRGAADGREELAALEQAESRLPEELERTALLKAVDRRWMDHIDDLEQLRESVGSLGYAQKDPLAEYGRAASRLFERMNEGIRRDMLSAVRTLAEKGGERE